MNSWERKTSVWPNSKGVARAFSVALVLTEIATAQAPRDLRSDTWVATDELGRSLPTSAEVGPPRKEKYVAVFYFLWLGRHGDLGPFDIATILGRDPDALKKPESPPWGPMLYPHHWGESIFGYYVADDEAVIRKHAQMLADADVDLIVFDVTNQLTYPESWRALGRVFDRMRREGNRVPQFAFLCPFGDPHKVVRELWHDLYEPGLHADLWFRWEGKPLILADPAALDSGIERGRRRTPVELMPGHTLGRTFNADRPFVAVGAACPTWATRDSVVTVSVYRRGERRERVASHRFEGVRDNAWLTLELDAPLPAGPYELELSEPKGHVGWWSDPRGRDGGALADAAAVPGDRTIRLRPADDPDAATRRFFTFRKPQPDYFQGPTGPNQWGWLEVAPQHAFYKTPGEAEEVAVGVGQNAADGKLSVFTTPNAHGRSFHDGKEPGPEGRDGSGRNFAEQWKRALEIDPKLVFVTNWNEWIAGRFSPANMPLHGTGPVTFVDEFDAEFSRDIEPMKGGHGDNYYYQMVANIRRFKGARPIPPVESKPINIDGKFDDWRDVVPEFRDTVGDPVHRDHRGWGKGTRYVNQSGRHDLVEAKVSLDPGNVSFYLRAADEFAHPDGILLFLDVDHGAKTGWLGYDFVVNRRTVGPTRTTLERNVGGRYEWGSPVEIPLGVSDRSLELSIPRTALGLADLPSAIDFKWADNLGQTGDWSDFTLNGDAAPNDRFNYRAILRAAP